ncbi:hypothetical protein SUGI_1017660 [Cryptomeria japonica]|uniref:flavonol synthase/flavanone 3-hydroxylase n=1 Tax=Cryptomeria japonica TaxID=3369 RepID=UPI002414BB94|nr:flavonol synthase/flavanone 3-hydroxylase [Cryptomeria japonica]GLJ48190.1 hypothetical protein SUGI_1017660 [Cryptomeria japonica]
MAAVRVQSIAMGGIEAIPSQFIRANHERPALNAPSAKIPLIDMSKLDASPDLLQQTVAEIGSAAQEWGIFQVVNHGVSDDLIRRLQTVGKEFFDLPQEEKETYANNAEEGNLEGYGTKLAQNIEGKLGWTDYYFHLLWPPSRRNFNTWPRRPSSYREVCEEYGGEIVDVVDKLLSALSINLGLQECSLKEAIGGENMEMEMKINYYPPCPQPDLALGVVPHTDMSALTLLVSNQVPGLQVHKDSNWVAVDYVPNAIIVHIGDTLQILSNGKYKNVFHRSVVSKDKVRMSWPVFCNPPGNKVLAPMKESLDDHSPALFAAKTFADYRRCKINKVDK